MSGGRGTTFRAHARRRVRLRALLTHIADGWQRHVDVSDLGLGGAGLVVDEALRAGDAISLSFVAPTLWDPLVVRARVAWASRLGVDGRGRAGVAFDPKTSQSVFALFELVQSASDE